jgi:hypothetical protein
MDELADLQMLVLDEPLGDTLAASDPAGARLIKHRAPRKDVREKGRKSVAVVSVTGHPAKLMMGL